METSVWAVMIATSSPDKQFSSKVSRTNHPHRTKPVDEQWFWQMWCERAIVCMVLMFTCMENNEKHETSRLIKYTSSMRLLGISMLLLRLQARLSWLYTASIYQRQLSAEICFLKQKHNITYRFPATWDLRDQIWWSRDRNPRFSRTSWFHTLRETNCKNSEIDG